MRSLVVVLIALASVALAQVSLPPDVSFVNAKNAQITGNFFGIPIKGAAQFQYLAGDSSKKPYQFHINHSISVFGQKYSAETWIKYTENGGNWNMEGAMRQEGKCEKNVASPQNASLQCSPWQKQNNNTWKQKCAVSIDSNSASVDFVATTSNSQLLQFGATVSAGATQGSITLNMGDQSSQPPAPEVFTIPKDCVTPAQLAMLDLVFPLAHIRNAF